jgi:hypothetical protein
LNLRPLAPHASALAKLRHAPKDCNLPPLWPKGNQNCPREHYFRGGNQLTLAENLVHIAIKQIPFSRYQNWNNPMKYALGNVNFAVKGNSVIAENFRNLLESLQTHDPRVDIVFDFVDELPAWNGRPYVSLDNYRIAGDRFRLTEKLFSCEFRHMEKPARILISPARTGFARKVQRAINKSWRYFHTHGRPAYLHHLKRFVFYIYMPFIELMLLKNQATLAHCSAIENNGRIVLFSAWGGVGKTSIMSLYLDNGWKFLSDDSCVIAANGKASIHPLPMHIYKYHERQSAELVTKMLSQLTSADRLLWRVIGKMKKPDRLVRWIAAEKVFGKEKISAGGKISAVVHMHRQMNCNSFSFDKVDAQDVAKLMASTILDEINNLANTSIVLHSCQPHNYVPDIGNLYRKIVDIYSSAFAAADCYTISIPQQATGKDTYSFLTDNRLFQ